MALSREMVEVVDWLRAREVAYRKRNRGRPSQRDLVAADELANVIQGIKMGRPAKWKAEALARL